MVSLPPPTKMFPFGGFPLPTWEHRRDPRVSAIGGPIRGSPDLRLHAPPRGLSQLAAPFFGAQAEPSTRRRRRAGSTRVQRLFNVGPMRGVHRESDSLTFTLPPSTFTLGGACMIVLQILFIPFSDINFATTLI